MTEASLFARAGLPAVVCGPGDIAQAHQPDEFVALSQLESCLAFLERLPRS
ncbi:MAG: M20/M25/M40 family metallo-hydrolase [Rhodospirillaceae bacterium]